MQSHNWIEFGHFFHFFCKFLKRHIKKELPHVKLFWPPQLKNLKFVMLWPQLLRSISNCVVFKNKPCIYLWFYDVLYYLCSFLNKSWTLPWKFDISNEAFDELIWNHCEIAKDCPEYISWVVKVSSWSYQKTFLTCFRNWVVRIWVFKFCHNLSFCHCSTIWVFFCCKLS